MTAYPNALSEFQIGSVTLPNRIVRTAHVTMLGLDAPSGISERLIAYHEARARGGVGLSILEICSGHPSSPATLNAFNPALLDGYKQLVERIQPHGMKLFQQIWHGGHNTLPLGGGAPWSASDIAGPTIGVPARPMTPAMIGEAIEGYVLAARVAQSGGLDGVEVHGSHGYLIQQFLSPITNRREDDYGGSFENRMRFLIEVLTAVRSEVGRDFPVGVRVGPDMAEGGFGVEDCIRLVKALDDLNLADFVDISQGSYFVLPKIIGAMHEPTGYMMAESCPIAAATTKPTIVTGRFRTLEEAEQVIRNGEADCVSMVRATIADPDLVRKTIEGEVTDVRPCIACNQTCIGNQTGKKIALGCTVNPAVGHEGKRAEQLFVTVDEAKNVLIVGGGPAGMEAARTAVLRGHKVTLCEADKDLGGKLRMAKRVPFRVTIGDVATWLESEIYRLGVDINLNTYLGAEDIAAYEPDAVVVATGTMPRYDGFHFGEPGTPLAQGNRLPLTTFDVFAQAPSPTDGPFVVEDDIGHYEGIAVAEFLLQAGCEVIFVTRHPSLAPLMEPAFSAEPALKRMSANERFRIHTRSSVANTATGIAINTPDGSQIVVGDGSLVLVTLESPNYELLESLEQQGTACQIIGDAQSPRFLETAILEGRLAGMKL